MQERRLPPAGKIAANIDFRIGAVMRRNGASRRRMDPAPGAPKSSKRALTADDPEQDNDDGDDQQDVNKAAQRVGGDQAEQPEDDQNDCNGIEHDGFPFLV
jgi:hypothetical protein